MQWKLQYEVQKCNNFVANVASNGKYLKRYHVTPLLRGLIWINFNCILRLNEASFMYKNLCFSRFKWEKNRLWPPKQLVSQRIPWNGSDVYTLRLSKNSSVTKICFSIGGKALEFDPDEYQKFKYHRYVQKSYVYLHLN